MARPIEEQQFGAAFEQRLQRHHLIIEVGGGAVEEHQGRQRPLGRGNMDIVQAGAADIAEMPDRRVTALDLP